MTNLIISQELVQQIVDQTVEKFVTTALENLQQDPAWISKIETMINQMVVQKTLSRIGSIDVDTVIKNQVNARLDFLKEDIVNKTIEQGIQSTASQIELTILDDHVVVENSFSAKNINVIDTATIKNLSVTGTINVDNRSWDNLAEEIGRRSLASIDQNWQDQLVAQVAEKIKTQGIDFSEVTVNGDSIIANNALSKGIVRSSLQKVGVLEDLSVAGEAQIYDTLNVTNRRVGINTKTPEMALSIWDEDVNIITGRLKTNVAYIGTGRSQNLSIGVNRISAIDINIDGLTTIKKLQVGMHSIGHDNSLPGYSGTRGDIVFNINTNVSDNIFAWVCLGGHKWKELRSA